VTRDLSKILPASFPLACSAALGYIISASSLLSPLFLLYSSLLSPLPPQITSSNLLPHQITSDSSQLSQTPNGTMSGLFTKVKEAIVGPSETESTEHDIVNSSRTTSGSSTTTGTTTTSSTSGTGKGYVGGSVGETVASYIPGTEAHNASLGISSSSDESYVGGSTGKTVASYVPGTEANAASKGITSNTTSGQSITEKAASYVPGTEANAASKGTTSDAQAHSVGEKVASYIPGTEANAASKGTTSTSTHSTGSAVLSGAYTPGSTSSYTSGIESGEVHSGRANIAAIVREELAAEAPTPASTKILPTTDAVFKRS